MTGDKLEQMPK